MSPDETRIEAVFLRALEIQSLEERAAYLQQACAGDDEFHRRVERLLAAQPQMGSFLDQNAAEMVLTSDQPAAERPGTVIGPYKLLQQIGEGGMGTVYMAEQTEPVQRKVALKVIKAGMDSRQVVARFEAERQALAMMDHVNIARVLDAGTTGGKSDGVSLGRPYFVMELVHGVPITKYCDDNHLTPRERLELFVPICQAIQHAHQKGVIHRDIKPSNVMVTLYDGQPVPKVIDFGVAKATEQKLTERTLFTQYGTMVGTLEYMSPEQAEMSALGVDTRSDIYSLGVLLYELLTGSTPLTHKRMKEAAHAEILRMIKEEEPPRPSTRLSDSGEALASISANRHTEPAKLTKLVRGELDWIVMKTLEKDRNRRYETANGFAADVQRYLNDEAVQACPPSVRYRLRKFVRRNKGPVLAAALVAVALVMSVMALAVHTILITRERAEIARQRDAAETQRKLARRAVDRMFTEVAEKWLSHRAALEPLQRQFLGEALQFYQEFAKEQSTDPAVRLETANAFRRMGEIHQNLGDSTESESAFQQACVILEKLVEAFPSEPAYRSSLATNYHQYGFMLHYSHRQQDALRRYGQALIQREQLAKEFPTEFLHRYDVAVSLGGVANLLEETGAIADSEAGYLRAIELLKNLPSSLADQPDCRYQLGLMYSELSDVLSNFGAGRALESERMFYKGKAVYEKLVTEFPREPKYREEFVWALHREAKLGGIRPKDAEKACRQAIAISEGLVSESPTVPVYQVGVGFCYLSLGNLLRKTGRLQEAEQAYNRAVQVCETIVADFPGWRTSDFAGLFANSHRDLGSLLSATGRPGEAEQVLLRGIKLHQKLATDAPKSADLHNDLAWLLATCPDAKLRQPARAVELAKKAVELAPQAGHLWTTLGVAQYRAADGKAAFEAMAKSMKLSNGGDSVQWFFLAMAHWRLAQKEEARKWYDRAVQWMEKNAPQNEELRRFRAEAEELLGIKKKEP